MNGRKGRRKEGEREREQRGNKRTLKGRGINRGEEFAKKEEREVGNGGKCERQ